MPGNRVRCPENKQPADRDRRIGEPPDRVDEIVAGQPLVAADVVRVHEIVAPRADANSQNGSRSGSSRLPPALPFGIVAIIAPLKPWSSASSSTRAASAPFCSGTVASALSVVSAAASFAMCSL